MQRIAMLAVHSSPLAKLGGREAGGMNVYVRELAREFGRRGVAVDIFTRSQRRHEPTITEIGPNARVITVRTGPAAPYNKNWVLDYLPEFVSRVRCFAEGHDLQYDVIHSHYWLSGLAALELRNLWNVPVVHMFHTLGAMKNQVATAAPWAESDARIEIERQLLRDADAIVAATPLDRTQMVFHYNVDSDRIVVIPCGVDTQTFRPYDQAEARERLGLPAQPAKIVLFVGRIEPLKGLDTLIQATKRLIDDEPALRDTLKLVVVGGDALAGADQWGGEERRVRELVDQLGLQQQAAFVGSRPQAQLPLWYSAADAVAVPSHYESFGLVALEAQACGAPVVASRVGGLTYTIQDGVSGRLVPFDQPNAFAVAIKDLVLHEGLREEMGSHAITNARAYSWDNIAIRMLQLYDSLIGKRQPAPHVLPLSIPRCSLL